MQGNRGRANSATITPTDDGGTPIETKRYYESGGTAGTNTISGACSKSSPLAK
jgi:hypothetical protein